MTSLSIIGAKNVSNKSIFHPLVLLVIFYISKLCTYTKIINVCYCR